MSDTSFRFVLSLYSYDLPTLRSPTILKPKR